MPGRSEKSVKTASQPAQVQKNTAKFCNFSLRHFTYSFVWIRVELRDTHLFIHGFITGPFVAQTQIDLVESMFAFAFPTCRLMVNFIPVLLAVLSGTGHLTLVGQQTPQKAGPAPIPRNPELEELRHTHELVFGGSVEIQGITSPLTVENHARNWVEIQITRKAFNRELFQTNPIQISGTDQSLVIQQSPTEPLPPELTQQVTIRLPFHLHLTIKKVNGPVKLNGLANETQLKEIQGSVTCDKVNGPLDINQVQGDLSMSFGTFPDISHPRIFIEDVSGNTSLRLATTDQVQVKGTVVLGGVSSEVADLAMEKQEALSSFIAHQGEPRILVSLVHLKGRVMFVSINDPPAKINRELLSAPMTYKRTQPTQNQFFIAHNFFNLYTNRTLSGP